jgi:histidinol-phosphate aminotransferase
MNKGPGMTRPFFKGSAMDLAPLPASLPETVPFTGPETLERNQGFPFRARLGANESTFGPSPLAIRAMQDAAQNVWMYGDPEAHDLKAAIAARHGVTPDHIAVGEGIDGLLGLTTRLILSPGDNVVTSDGAYPTFNFHVAGHGGILHKVPYRNDHEDPAALLAKAHETKARMIYLANPDNPMGSQLAPEIIQDMARNLPPNCLLALDEAYGDLATLPLPQIDPMHPQVIRFRTLSKAHGLAGLRVGYAITNPALARAFDRIRNHFALGRIAQAGAIAALQDTDWLAQVQDKIRHARQTLTRIAESNGLTALPSSTNFLTIDTGRDATYARSVLTGLQAEGIFIRMPGVAPLNRCIRISLADDATLDILAEALPRVLRAL